MADETIKMKFVGESDMSRLQADLSRSQLEADKLKGALAATEKQLARTSRATTMEGGSASVAAYASQLLRATTAAFGLSAVISKIGEANQQWIADMDKIDASMEEVSIKMQIQTGKTSAEVQSAIKVIGRVSAETPTTGGLPASVLMQNFLASSGLDKKDVESGEAFKAVAETLAALNAYGSGGEFASGTDAAKVLTNLQQGFRLPGTAAGLRAVGAPLATAFAETKLTGAQIPAFAKEAGGFRTFGGDVTETLAVFARLVNAGLPAETAATGMRNFFTKLSDVKPGGERDVALQSVGLTQAEIAPRVGGPKLLESLDKIAKALEGRSELEKNAFLTQTFGAENATALANMLSERGEARKLQGKLADSEAFQTAVATFRQSDFARRKGFGLQAEISAFEGLQKQGGVSWAEVDVARSAHFNRRRAESGGFFESVAIGLSQVSGSMHGGVAQFFGLSPMEVAGAAVGTKEDVQIIRDLLSASERTANASERSAAKRFNRNGNVEPASSLDGMAGGF